MNPRWRSESSDGPTGDWPLLSFSLFLSVSLCVSLSLSLSLSNYLLGRALIDGRMVSCTFISVLTQMYEWWYGKSSTLAIRNACTTSHVHVHILACHILTSKKTTSLETLSGVFTSVHDFYFHPPLICKKSRQLLENLAWILSQKCMVSPCPLKHF